MMNMSQEKKRCPFCGNKHLYVIGINDDMDCEQEKILCADCGATGPFADSPEEAWEKWNKRGGDDG
ncbi:MAG: restriction alleviation protein, Lar family [Desulfovibrio sp.]|nr:restriction alleviation protein, Lar family [Desulfovibrio sp.]